MFYIHLLSDFQGGVVVLLLTVCLQAYVNNGGRRLAVDVGGAKRLQALTAIVSVGFLVPLALLVWITQVGIGLVLITQVLIKNNDCSRRIIFGCL